MGTMVQLNVMVSGRRLLIGHKGVVITLPKSRINFDHFISFTNPACVSFLCLTCFHILKLLTGVITDSVIQKGTEKGMMKGSCLPPSCRYVV